jgi:hypothetical protein
VRTSGSFTMRPPIFVPIVDPGIREGGGITEIKEVGEADEKRMEGRHFERRTWRESDED